MPNPRVFRGEIFEDTDWFAQWRNVGANGSIVDQADVTSYDIYYFDMSSDTPGSSVYSLTGQTAFDGSTGFELSNAYVADGFWHPDTIGRNVKYQVRNALFPGGQRGGRRYSVEIVLHCATASFPPYGWGDIMLKAEVSAKSRLSG